MVMEAEHEAGGRGVPVVVAWRGVQLAAPCGHGVEFTVTVSTVAAVVAVTVADVTHAADADTATQSAQRGLPRRGDRGIGVAAGRAARPVAGAGHRPSVHLVRGHHRDAFRAHSRSIRVRQRACAQRTTCRRDMYFDRASPLYTKCRAARRTRRGVGRSKRINNKRVVRSYVVAATCVSNGVRS